MIVAKTIKERDLKMRLHFKVKHPGLSFDISPVKAKVGPRTGFSSRQLDRYMDKKGPLFAGLQ